MAKKKKCAKWQKKVLICGTVIACIFGLVYAGGAFYYKDKFFKGTKINGVSCENLTAREAEEKIEDKIEDYSLEITFKNGEKEIINGKEISYEYLSDGKIQEHLENQNPFLWTSGFFKEHDYEVGEAITFDDTKLQEKLNTFACMQEENMIPPKDAYIAFENNSFVIKPEEAGSTLDKALLTEKLLTSVKESKNTFSAEEAGVYVLPTVTDKDETLKHQQEVWNGCAAVTVTYTFGDKKEVLDGMTVKDWMTYDENGNYAENLGVLQQHIRDYVQTLGEKYNTIGTKRTLTSTYTGEPVTVSGTYNDKSRRTPSGIYSLAYKQRNQVLRPAPNPDGTYDYESPVSYWMPFNGGIGLHDANWRGRFGGNIYRNSGSHGCINLPVSFAGKFYESIEAGCPIVCFYR